MYNKTWWESNSNMNSRGCSPQSAENSKLCVCVCVCVCVHMCVCACVSKELLSYPEISVIPVQLYAEIKFLK